MASLDCSIAASSPRAWLSEHIGMRAASWPPSGRDNELSCHVTVDILITQDSCAVAVQPVLPELSGAV